MTNLCKNFFCFHVKMCMFSADKYIYFLISLSACDSSCRNTDLEFTAARLDIAFFSILVKQTSLMSILGLVIRK